MVVGPCVGGKVINVVAGFAEKFNRYFVDH